MYSFEGFEGEGSGGGAKGEATSARNLFPTAVFRHGPTTVPTAKVAISIIAAVTIIFGRAILRVSGTFFFRELVLFAIESSLLWI
jgi:hypothetical protein